MDTWNAFLKWFAESQIASVLRVMLAFVVNAAVLEFVKSGSFSLGNYELWIIGGLSACLPMLLRLINPADPLGAKG